MGDFHALCLRGLQSWKPLDLLTHACFILPPQSWYLVSYLLVRISPSIRPSEIDASGVLFVCLSAVRCLERTNRAGRLLLSVYREKSVGMRETEVKWCCLSWTETKKYFFLLTGFTHQDVPYGLVWSRFLRCENVLLKICFWKWWFEANTSTAWLLCGVRTSCAVLGFMANLLEWETWHNISLLYKLNPSSASWGRDAVSHGGTNHHYPKVMPLFMHLEIEVMIIVYHFL